jgi:hypothetical protein
MVDERVVLLLLLVGFDMGFVLVLVGFVGFVGFVFG